MTWSQRIVVIAGLCAGCLDVPERGLPCAADADCGFGGTCYRQVCVGEADAGFSVPILPASSPEVEVDASAVAETLDGGPAVDMPDAGSSGDAAEDGSVSQTVDAGAAPEILDAALPSDPDEAQASPPTAPCDGACSDDGDEPPKQSSDVGPKAKGKGKGKGGPGGAS